MIDNLNKNVFEKILSPIQTSMEEAQNSIHGDSERYKLSLSIFSRNLFFGIICKIKSISLLVTEIKTSSTAKALELVPASKSMYNEAFNRYESEIFKKIFFELVTKSRFQEISELYHLGKLYLVDGSLFPAISSMGWAAYKKTTNAVKMHLSFELNRMIPVEFLSTEGNFSEKSFLKHIVKEGKTYICDRGYISFNLFKHICDKCAYFIIRGKSNMQYIVEESFDISVPDKFLKFFENIQDFKIKFTNDLNTVSYRMIKFEALGKLYVIFTNRFDLTTYEIVMLYAYRWQVELFFRFLKRTFNGIHLMHQSANGIEVQFYLFMIVHILLLLFKQKIETSNNAKGSKSDSVDALQNDLENGHDQGINVNANRPYVCGLVSLLGEQLKKFFKIGIHWLTVIKNLLLEPFDRQTIKIILYTPD